MTLLERESDLDRLNAALSAASTGRGSIVLVGGEAGIGKTTFVEHFLATGARGVVALKGNCDALFTPSPLAPLYDVARQLGDKTLLGQLESGSARPALFSAFAGLLQDRAQPIVLVIEDVHWADEATLDLLKYLGRRIASMRALVIVTYRDDEIGRQHPLNSLLGSLSNSKTAVRVILSHLSLEAVRQLIGSKSLNATAIYRRTAGNPFFTSEIIAHSSDEIPSTVRDAVQARVDNLKPRSRKLLEQLAVLGSRIEHGVLEEIAAPSFDGLAECIRIGMLREERDELVFRHELTREAVLASIDPLRRRQLYRFALKITIRAIGAGRIDLAELAHFAEGAADTDAVIKYGVAAAEAAEALGARREAAAQYRRVLRFADGSPERDRASYLEGYARSCAVIDDLDEAVSAYQQAVELWHQAGDRLKKGESSAALAWCLVRNGRNAAAEDAIGQAIALLTSMDPTRQLADAYRMKAHMHMLDRKRGAAVQWGRRAIELAADLGDHATVAAGEMVIGAAILVSGDDRGRIHLDKCLVAAREHGLDALAALAMLNLGSSYGEQHRFDEAERELTEGIVFARSRDLDHANHYMTAWLALTRLYQGRWAEAGDLAGSVIREPNVAAISRIMALVALGRLRARRGDPGAEAALDEALELASPTGTLQRVAPVHAARAELAWLSGDSDRAAGEARMVFDLAVRRRHRWHVGELGYWRSLGKDLVSLPKWAAMPFAHQIQGNWKRAAQGWRSLRCPYEEARALAEGDVPAQMRALEMFDVLGAGPAAATLRRRLRSAGIHRIPRGQRPSTRSNPFNLTSRQLETLDAIGRGLSNAEIGATLHISPKTVDHHVSAILTKLGATSRTEAARIASKQNREVSDTK